MDSRTTFTLTTGLLLAATLLAPRAGQASEAPVRVERPRAVSLGLMAVRTGDELLPMPAAQLVWGVSPQISLLADLSYMDYHDRAFGPRMFALLGGRGYLAPDPVSPYVAARLGLYHEFDVQHLYSDYAQRTGDWFVADLVIGIEIALRIGLTWGVEVGTIALADLRAHGDAARNLHGLHVQTMFGYRF
jgi:hypothetical protein